MKMSLTDEAYSDRMWAELETLRSILLSGNGAINFDRRIDFLSTERIYDLLKIHALCMDSVDRFLAKNNDHDQKQKIQGELRNLSSKLQYFSQKLHDKSVELDEIVKDISDEDKVTNLRLDYMSSNEFWPRRHEFHCLTYAEEGFAPLNEFVKGSDITRDQLTIFADKVNSHNIGGSFFPIANVSAVPRSCVRDSEGHLELRLHIDNFLEANKKSIHAKNLVIDLGVPEVSRVTHQIIEDMAKDGRFDDFKEVVVLGSHPRKHQFR